MEISLEGEHPELQQPINGQPTSNAHEPTAEVRLAEIQAHWKGLDNPTADDRKRIITELKELTARTKAPDRPGALHPESEPYSTNER